MEVFLIDVLQLKVNQGKKIYKFMKKTAGGEVAPEPEEKKQDSSTSNKSSSSSSASASASKENSNKKKVIHAAAKEQFQFGIPKKKKEVIDVSAAKWANLVCRVSMHSKFDNWKTFNYSPSKAVDVVMIEQRLQIAKGESGQFKILKNKFVYAKKENPKGYKLAVRTENNDPEEAQKILDSLQSKLDAILETVQKIQKFKYQQCLDKIVAELSDE
eukprot:530909_1